MRRWFVEELDRAESASTQKPKKSQARVRPYESAKRCLVATGAPHSLLVGRDDVRNPTHGNNQRAAWFQSRTAKPQDLNTSLGLTDCLDDEGHYGEIECFRGHSLDDRP